MILRNGELAISNKQIAWHIGSFIVFFIANMLLVGILVNRYNINQNLHKGQKTLQLTLAAAIVGITLSEFPILHIIYSLVKKGISDKV